MKIILEYYGDRILKSLTCESREIEALASEVRALRRELSSFGDRIMASLDDILNDVNGESTVIDSLVTLLQGIKSQLDSALSGTTLPPAVQSKIDAIFASAEANKAKLAAAVTANTPAVATNP